MKFLSSLDLYVLSSLSPSLLLTEIILNKFMLWNLKCNFKLLPDLLPEDQVLSLVSKD